MMGTRGDSAFGAARAIYTRILRAIFPTLNPDSHLKQVIEIARTIFPILDPHYYLKQVTGVIHVGANVGQERERYARYKLKVLWIEPLPNVFEQLCKNIKSFPDQEAVNHLITDKDDVEYLFHVSNNGGQASSILDLARSSEIWPDVQ